MLIIIIKLIIGWAITYTIIVGYVNSSEYRIGDGGIRRIKRSKQEYRETFGELTYEELPRVKK